MAALWKKRSRRGGGALCRRGRATRTPCYHPRVPLRLAALAQGGVVVWLAIAQIGFAQSTIPKSAPTFARDVAPIVYTHCAECHHTGGPAPFSLTSYAEVRQRAKQIAAVTKRRYMPPW